MEKINWFDWFKVQLLNIVLIAGLWYVGINNDEAWKRVYITYIILTCILNISSYSFKVYDKLPDKTIRSIYSRVYHKAYAFLDKFYSGAFIFSLAYFAWYGALLFAVISYAHKVSFYQTVAKHYLDSRVKEESANKRAHNEENV